MDRSLARSLARRAPLAWLGTIALLCLPIAARANEVSGHGALPGVVIHDATETLRDYVREMDGGLWLALPDGSRFELVTSTSDPTIANPGDGAFHPFDRGEIEATLRDLRFPLGTVSVEIFALPYPRRGALDSAAGPGLVFLSPGVRPISREQQHAELTHELGHVAQYALMPDDSAEPWARYRELRAIEDESRFSSGAPHASRPHEIFAEDFRALFGDPLATYSGTIENQALAAPETVPGLRDFLLALAGSTPIALTAAPNPARGPVRFLASRATIGTPGPLDVFDLAGRRVASASPVLLGDRIEWSWDGRDEHGRPLPSGLLLARPRGATGAALRITRLP